MALLGAGGHGKVVAEIAMLSGWNNITFFDDNWPSCDRNGLWRIEGNTSDLIARLSEFDGVVVTIGDCIIRWQKHKALQTAGATITTVIHPTAIVSPLAKLGVGSVVMAGAIVNIDSLVGESVIINTNATVEHDCWLGDAVHICPGAHLAGNVRVGNGGWIGVGATINQGVVIGEKTVVGAGAVVIASVGDGLTVIGNPARPYIKLN